jgi:DNA polymerase elongation subunit (family B)
VNSVEHTADGDPILYGKDPTVRIVGLHPLLDDTADPHPVMRVFRRSEDGSRVVVEDDAYYPFFYLSDIRHLRGFSRPRFRFQELEGDNFYRFLVAFSTWRAYLEGLRHVRNVPTYDAAYAVPGASQQYLLQTGRTLFKNMTFDELHRMQLDIETYSSQEFSNAKRPEDRILLIALSDNHGWRLLIDGREHAEKDMLRLLLEVVAERDPDVIEGHNILGFDLPYLAERCRRHGLSLAIGRGGGAPRTFPATMRFAERNVEYTVFDVAGRHVVDTYFLVLSHDAVKRDMPAYGLKAAARYFGFAPAGRTYVRGEDISRIWHEDPDRLARYALDDVLETERLARHLSGSTFYLTQIVPMPYDQAARTGPAAKIEALFIREYLRRKHSVPRGEAGSQSAGGYTDIFFTGVAGPIVYADVESLYPSIMLEYGVRPKRDDLDLFRELLRRLTHLRLETKRAMEAAAGDGARSELDARQSSYKVLINSFYGQLGFSQALFNDFSEADRVASLGRELIRGVIRRIAADGGRVIEVDTDGVLFVPPEHARGAAAERTYARSLSDDLPTAIRIGFEGRFRKMLSYKKKNYALLGYDGTLTFKGSSLVSRSVERFGRRFVREGIRRLLVHDVEGLHDLYLDTREAILRHDWKGVESFSRTETLKDSIRQYRADVRRGRRPRAAAYELAVERTRRTGRPARKGDRVSYYVTGHTPTVTTFRNCRAAEEWDPNDPDENTAHYLKRLDEFARKFETFFLPHDFRLVFSPEDMFGFSAGDITLQSHERSIEPFVSN